MPLARTARAPDHARIPATAPLASEQEGRPERRRHSQALRSPLSNQKKPVSPHVSQPRMANQREVRTRQNHSCLEAARGSQSHPMSLPTKSAPSGNPRCRLCHKYGKDSAIEVRAAPEAPSNSPCCRQCPKPRRVPLPVAGQQLLPVRTLRRVNAHPDVIIDIDPLGRSHLMSAQRG